MSCTVNDVNVMNAFGGFIGIPPKLERLFCSTVIRLVVSSQSGQIQLLVGRNARSAQSTKFLSLLNFLHSNSDEGLSCMC